MLFHTRLTKEYSTQRPREAPSNRGQVGLMYWHRWNTTLRWVLITSCVIGNLGTGAGRALASESDQDSQSEFFEGARELVESVMDGFNVLVFAYGPTGSGKSHTMMGTPENEELI